MNRISSLLGMIFVGLVFAFISGGTLFAALGEFFEMGRGMAHIIGAERMTAEVTSSGVEDIWFPPTNRRSSGETYYRPYVGYSYAVDGRAYTSTRVTPLNQHAGRDWATELAARFQPGRTYQGYYDPDRPGEAFLVAEIHWVKLVMALFALVMAAPCLYFSYTIARALVRAGRRPARYAAGSFAGTRQERRRQLMALRRRQPRSVPAYLEDFTLELPPRMGGLLLLSVAGLLEAIGIAIEHPFLMLIPAAFLGVFGAFFWWVESPGALRPPSQPAPAPAPEDSGEPY